MLARLVEQFSDDAGGEKARAACTAGTDNDYRPRTRLRFVRAAVLLHPETERLIKLNRGGVDGSLHECARIDAPDGMIVANNRGEPGNHKRGRNDQRRPQLTSPSRKKCQQRQPPSENNREDQCAREEGGRPIGAYEDDQGGNRENDDEQQRSQTRLDFITRTRADPAITTKPEPLQQRIDEAGGSFLRASYKCGLHQ